VGHQNPHSTKKNPADYQVKMKQNSSYRTEDTITKNSDKKKNLLKLRLQNLSTTRISQQMAPREERVVYNVPNKQASKHGEVNNAKKN
jgi:hypothetical protein